MGGLGVNLFIIISSWFLSSDNVKFSVSKIWELSKVVILYSLIWYISLVLHNDFNFSVKWLVKMVVTPFIGSYWFVTAFLIFYMLCPLLNVFVRKLTDGQLKKATVVLTIVICIYHTIFGGETSLMGVMSTFVYLFVMTAYLRRAPGNFIEQHCVISAVFSYVFIVGVSFVLYETGRGEQVTHFADRSSVFLILLAVSLFYLFKSLHIKNSFINLAAGSTFAVYILHQFWWGWHYIWEIAGVQGAYQKGYFPFHMMVTAFVILIICIAIDLIRRLIGRKLRQMGLSEKIYELLQKIDDKIII